MGQITDEGSQSMSMTQAAKCNSALSGFADSRSPPQPGICHLKSPLCD